MNCWWKKGIYLCNMYDTGLYRRIIFFAFAREKEWINLDLFKKKLPTFQWFFLFHRNIHFSLFLVFFSFNGSVFTDRQALLIWQYHLWMNSICDWKAMYSPSWMGATLSPSSSLLDEDPGIMSEAETSSTGFRRGSKQRSSLPVVRTTSKTLERPLGEFNSKSAYFSYFSAFGVCV